MNNTVSYQVSFRDSGMELLFLAIGRALDEVACCWAGAVAGGAGAMGGAPGKSTQHLGEARQSSPSVCCLLEFSES